MSEGHTERLEAALDGKYLIESKLGEGGMATVYLAQDVKHERKVALKILKPELAAVIGAERFLTEIKTTAGPPAPSYPRAASIQARPVATSTTSCRTSRARRCGTSSTARSS